MVAGKPGRVETPKRKALRAAVSATIENIRFITDTSSPSNSVSLMLNLKQSYFYPSLPFFQELSEIANIQTHSQAAWHQRIQSKTAAREWKVREQVTIFIKLLFCPLTLFFLLVSSNSFVPLITSLLWCCPGAPGSKNYFRTLC